MIRLLVKIARALGFLLLAALALWFLPMRIFGRCGGPGRCPESADPEYLHYEQLRKERRRRWLFEQRFRRWERKQARDRFKRIEKIRNNFYK